MWQKCVLRVLSILVLGPALAARAGFDPNLAVYWPFDEGQGVVADDVSGKGNQGTLFNDPAWVAGRRDGALRFNGLNSYVEGAYIPLNNRSFTVAAWVNPVLTASAIVFSERQANSANQNLHLRLGADASTDAPARGIRFGFYSNDLSSPDSLIQDNTWYHLVVRYDIVAQKRQIYVNGTQVVEGASSPYLGTSGNIWVGRGDFSGGSQYFNGIIDDVQIYQKALSEDEIRSVMRGLYSKSQAQNVSPADGAVDVPRDASLTWTAGRYAGTHDVYLGTAFADVNTAARTAANGVLAGLGEPQTTFVPAGPFAYGQTYYWRVDEVNKDSDNTIFKGNVWSFTAEPYTYPIKPLAATASSFQAGMGPEKTIDGSGLDAADRHGTDATTMWLSDGVQPNWIQYEFDRVYKLYQATVWNSNQLIEKSLGLGARNVTIETSTDGTAWTRLSHVPEFAKAPGADGYVADTTVDFGGVMAQYVRLTINTSWSGSAVTGLSEVRFSYIPVQARNPEPAAGATGVEVNTSLNWRPGREAVSHKVFFGTDQAAVTNGTASARTAANHTFDPGALTFGTTCYWRVDEVNTIIYPGDVWSFTSREFAVVDDFESYNDDNNRIYDSWIDGMTDGQSGSVVGYMAAPFAEHTVVHSGKQSMPLDYNNVRAPFYSEAQRTFLSPQNWTTNGADTLTLYFRGYPAAFVDNGNNSFTLTAGGTDIWGSADQCRFAGKQLTGDGSITLRVDSLANTNSWAKAGPMIRETLDPGAKNALVAVTPGNGVELQHRDTTNGTSARYTNVTGLTAPYWLRLTRTGNVFKGERSADGKTWTQVGSDTTIVMTATVCIGMAVSSHNTSQTTTVGFSNVAAAGAVTGPWQTLALGVTQKANDAAPLYLVVEDKAGKKKTVIHPNPAASTVVDWTPWLIPFSDLSVGGLNLAAVQKITLGVGDRTNPKAGPAGTLYIDDIGYGHPL